jgi:hypothetical protein
MKLNDTFIRQQDNPGALLNNDIIGLKNYKEARSKILHNQHKIEQINKIEQEMNTLKTELNDIKHLLLKVLESNNK